MGKKPTVYRIVVLSHAETAWCAEVLHLGKLVHTTGRHPSRGAAYRDACAWLARKAEPVKESSR